jgi:hypothetical protein
MASTFTIQLPGGTDVTKLINIPTAGAWLGGVVVSWCTHTTDMTVHEAIWINEFVPGNPNVKGYRHANLSGEGPTFDEWVLPAETRIWKVLFAGETMFKLRYTCENDVSVSIESTQTAWKSSPYPQYSPTPPTLWKYDGRLEWVAK